MNENDQIKEAYNFAVRKLSVSALTERQIEVYLSSKGYTDDIVFRVAQKLKDYGYIDDLQYAVRMVRRAIESKPKGSVLLAHEMRLKGIEESLITNALTTIDNNEQQAMAETLACKYLKRYKNTNIDKIRYKISQALLRKGFERSIVSRVINNISIDD